MGKKLTQSEFIDRCVSGNPSLDYSETIYKGAREKVYIKCSKHGGFWIKANDFLRSLKCPNCARNVPTTEEFIEKCKNSPICLQRKFPKYFNIDWDIIPDYKSRGLKIKKSKNKSRALIKQGELLES